jgi:hypothetical protein
MLEKYALIQQIMRQFRRLSRVETNQTPLDGYAKYAHGNKLDVFISLLDLLDNSILHENLPY